MTDRFTSVDVPGAGHEGFMEAGRVAPAEMIAALREIARQDRDAAQAVLDAADDDFVVKTFRGVHVQRDSEVLWPATVEERAREAETS